MTDCVDVGAGLKAIRDAVLNGRVTPAVQIDTSPAQLAVAREETERRNHAGQVEFLHGDFSELAHRVAAADIVTID